MARRVLLPVLSALLISASGAALAQGVPANITAALASKARTEADVKRDAARHPGELLAFAEVKPGQKVADFIMGGGYFTRILSAAVGPNGKVFAYQPGEFIKFSANYGEALKKAGADLPNVTTSDAPFASLDLPDGLDLVYTVQNYHDLHLKPFPADTAAKVNAEVFKSLKPGGLFVIVDHAANAGTGLEVADSLHRIDPAIVRKEVEAAGFKFVGETQVLRTKDDPHTANVFDPAIRGKTDQFALKFRKPK